VKDIRQIRVRVNGAEHELAIETRRTLADMLRYDLGYTGTHLGCEHGICGACTVLVDSSPVRSCLVFGVQADGCDVRTVEGLADGEELSDLQQAFSDHHGLQCGFCTPGFLMLAMFLEKSGLGPQETADVQVSTCGMVRVLSGGTSLGQGVETVLGQIAADGLGVDLSAVSVVCGDTDLQPFGMGSWASRTTVVAGNAVHAAAQAVRQRVTELAARMLEVAEDDLTVSGGAVCVRGDPAASVTLAEVARAAAPASGYLRPGEPAGLSARRRFDVAHMTYPYGVHVAVVEVDRGTGLVRVLRYLVAYEVGRAVNPMLVEGQLRGGAAQGIGGALLEEFGYDEAGQPQATTFIDYRMPTAAEVPPIDVLVTQQSPAPGNPLGVRGAGEGGISAAGAVLASAVRDALGLAGSVGRLPLTAARAQALAARGSVAPPAQPCPPTQPALPGRLAARQAASTGGFR
jgi:aerobic-type carbon monoxide dehydrogenase small subunit (CoxS/CutS family)